MIQKLACSAALLATIASTAHAQRTAAANCAAMQKQHLTDVKITEAVAVAATRDTTTPVHVAHCRVAGTIGKEIRFVALLPDAWNGKFFMGGGGGYVGSVDNSAIGSVDEGYASVGTDTGHEGTPIEAKWALGHPDRVENFGHVAVHRTAVSAKALVKAYYGKDPQRSYFLGCSNGGRQALMEAQRYPADFDGIVAAAPALDFTNFATSFIRNAQAAFPNPRATEGPAVPPELLAFVERRVLQACDALDGVKDGTLEDPRACHFKLSSIAACPADKPGADCLTKAQRTVLDRIYAPISDARGEVYPGQPFGGEGHSEGWPAWITGVGPHELIPGTGIVPSLQFAFGTEFYKYFVFGDSTWDYSKYDLKNWRRDTQKAAAILNTTDPEMKAFKARRGKLIIYHGWSDPALNAMQTIAYYDQVLKHDPNARDHARLFLVPGMFHCGGGTGPNEADWRGAIADWVERAHAPDRVIARERGAKGSADKTHPLCAYPARATYDGKGKTDDASSYSCKAPSSRP